jgi:exosortase A-associated hydrolase 2
MSSIDEKIFFFKGSKKRLLLGFLHKPISNYRSVGIVFCHPFADEQNLSHRVNVETARELTKLGFPVLRFDMSGCGDSQGELTEVTIADWQEDLKNAVDIMKKEVNVKSYALWGLRLGAGLALLHASKYGDVSSLILWQPVLDLSKYMQQFIRRKVQLQIIAGLKSPSLLSGLVNDLNSNGQICIIGYQITKVLYDSFKEIDKKPFLFIPSCPTLLLSISLMEQPSFQNRSYFDLLHSKGTSVQLSHINAEPFWDRYWRRECPEVTNAMLKWMENKVNG